MAGPIVQCAEVMCFLTNKKKQWWGIPGLITPLGFTFFLTISKVEDLRNASPATVSRAGIIFVSESDLDWQPVMERSLNKLPAARGDALRHFFKCALFIPSSLRTIASFHPHS